MLEGTDLLGLDESEMRAIRGNRISMIFQEPMTSLNPVMRIGDQITEAVRLHRPMSHKEAWNQAVEMLAPCQNSQSRSGERTSIRISCREACASAR